MKNQLTMWLIKEITEISISRYFSIIQRIVVVYFLLMFSNVGFSQSNHKDLRQGDKNYYQKNYLQAEEDYRKALEKNGGSVNANHNLGNSLYNQERYDEAAEFFEKAALESNKDIEKAMSYHNLGNSYLSKLRAVGSPEQAQEVLTKSMEAYKQALKNNPNDNATRYNLAYAQQLFQEFKQEQQQQQNNEQNQQQPPQEEENPSSGDGGEEEQNDENEQPKPKPSEGESMTKEEAERLIKIMEQEEKKVQEKMNKKNRQQNPNGKDW